MKKYTLYICAILVMLVLIAPACKKDKKAAISSITLDSNTVRAFGKQLEQAVLREDSAFFIESIDQSYIKKSLQSNTLVNSCLETEFGNMFYKAYFTDLASKFTNAIKNGGDFKFLKYYYKEGKHHIITRLYNDYTLRLDDWIIDTCDNFLKIRDAFFYSQSTTLQTDVEYSTQYQVLQYTHAGGAEAELSSIKALMMGGREEEALKLIAKNQAGLEKYPIYWQIYLKAIYESDYEHFIKNFDQYIAPHFDKRSTVLHKMIYYSNNGMIAETAQYIDSLIVYASDDPIFLFFYAKSLIEDGEYKDALICFDNLENVMPQLWDIWCAKLDCFYQLRDTKSFKETALQAKKLYGMPDDELLQFIDLHFPAMKNLNYFEKIS